MSVAGVGFIPLTFSRRALAYLAGWRSLLLLSAQRKAKGVNLLDFSRGQYHHPLPKPVAVLTDVGLRDMAIPELILVSGQVVNELGEPFSLLCYSLHLFILSRISPGVVTLGTTRIFESLTHKGERIVLKLGFIALPSSVGSGI